MSNTPNYDAKVKEILDGLQPGERTCEILGTKWDMDEVEIKQYKKYNVPPSKYHPLTRMKLINGHFVLFDMWYNKHADSGEQVISTTHPASGIKVLPDKEWFVREFEETAQDYDSNKPVMDQLFDITRSVPLAANYNYELPENSVAFISLGDKDSFMVLACLSKRCFYCMNGYEIEDSAEICLSRNVQKSYAVLHSERLHNCRFMNECYDCINSDFLFDCRNCENCFGATNKRNKKFLWFNEQLSEEEWKKRRSEVDMTTYQARQELETKYQELVSKAIWPDNFNIKAINCTGDYITECSNVTNGYYVMAGSNNLDWASYGFSIPSNDSYVNVAITGSSDCYYSLGTLNCSKAKFAMSILSNCIDTEYCGSSRDLEHCFGCFGLKKKKFCIFNKQYTEEEYWKTLDDIKCQMLDEGTYGDYPSMSLSTQHIPGSGAVSVYGASEEELKKMGAKFFEPGTDGAEGPEIDPTKMNSLDEIPDQVDSPDDLAGKVFFDETFNRRFAYNKRELEFYASLGIAPPRKHPTRRINELYAQMNMAVFEEKDCSDCGTKISVALNRTYPDRTIYCHDCYLKYLEQHG